MPDILPRPEAAGPSFLVKRLPISQDKNVVVSLTSPTRASSITATPIGVSIAQANPEDFAHSTRRASSFGEHSPLLSERDSIFATHYTSTENDPSTLHLSPPAGAVTEPSSVHPVNASMEFSSPPPPPPLVSTPSKLSIRSSLTAPRSGPSGIAGGVKQYGYTSSENPADKQLPASNGPIPGIRRVASDGHPWVGSSHAGSGHPTMLPRRDYQQEILNRLAKEDDKTQPDTNTTERKEEAEQSLAQGAQHPSAMSQAMRPTRTERSASRGRAHVDKSIEATLTNTEPGQNIRSRKSSHLMGVFRENTTPLESRQREANAQYTEEGHHTQTISGPSRPSGRPSSRPTSAAAPEAIPAQPESTPQENAALEWNQLYAPMPDQKLDSGLSSSQVSATPKLPQPLPAQPKSPSKHDHDPYFRKQDAIKQSKSSQAPPIPTNLLEQICEPHNLASMGGQDSHLLKDRTGFAGQEDTDFINRRQLRTRDIGGQPDENEEHISSAVYFPHPVPMEEIEQFNVPERSQLISGARTETGSSVPVATQTHSDAKWPPTDLAPPEHIDISVQSKHEKRVFHGDYQPPGDVQDEELERDILPTIKERPTESYAITSDSDIESGEDIGVTSQTDDGEITPTATPIVASQARRGKRGSISTGPKGAVLLEPYSHQVGGHSTIFRFSRRAVCKQLNNRENEFYERIERRHPDMLRFLPRFVPVLSLLPLSSEYMTFLLQSLLWLFLCILV
jgi:inositol-hexakisphosphate 5-kinase